ncbi:MAG: hypothetical protein B6241_00570 [Spirochaetaceae bacterium 4572_59]|nr:MAG: hypothetical protein B6241_00570 [Spirochaetaceae bacterium 4572_59]
MIKTLICLFLIFLFFFVGCQIIHPENINHDPLPLISPEMIDVSSGEKLQTFQLQCDTNPDNLYLYDEDGNTVRVVLDENTPLPAVIVLNEITGVLTVRRSAPFVGSAKFWTDDAKGCSTELDALTVRFTVTVTVAGSGNFLP